MLVQILDLTYHLHIFSAQTSQSAMQIMQLLQCKCSLVVMSMCKMTLYHQAC